MGAMSHAHQSPERCAPECTEATHRRPGYSASDGGRRGRDTCAPAPRSARRAGSALHAEEPVGKPPTRAHGAWPGAFPAMVALDLGFPVTRRKTRTGERTTTAMWSGGAGGRRWLGCARESDGARHAASVVEDSLHLQEERGDHQECRDERCAQHHLQTARRGAGGGGGGSDHLFGLDISTDPA